MKKLTLEDIIEKRKKTYSELIILPECSKCKENSFDIRFKVCLKCSHKEK